VRYSQTEDYFLSCGSLGGHGVPAANNTYLIDAATGTESYFPAGPVVDGIPLDEGFVVVGVEERSMGRSFDEENTLLAYSANGSLKWSRVVARGMYESLSYARGRILVGVKLHDGPFRAIVLDERSGQELFHHDLPYHGSYATALSWDGNALLFVREVRGPCAEVGRIDLKTGTMEWLVTLGSVTNWKARGGQGFGVVPHLAVSKATGHIAFATYWTRRAREGISELFMVDATGNEILHDEWPAHGGIRALEFRADSK
jgi:hypothetical protein